MGGIKCPKCGHEMTIREIIEELGKRTIVMTLRLPESTSQSEISDLSSRRIASAAVKANMACFDCGRRGCFVAN